MDISDAVAIAFITGLPPTIAAVAALLVSVRNGKKADKNTSKIEEIHAATNGMKDELVRATRSAAMQEGHTAGVADEKQRAEG